MPGLEGLIEEIRDIVEQDVRGVVTDVTNTLRERTPIDTTIASRSWIPGFGGSLLGTGEGATFSREDTTPEAQAARQQAGLALVATWTIGDGDLVITNSADYIVDLNAGSSPQAPAGFVELAILEGVNLDLGI